MHTNAGIENFRVKFPHKVFLNSNDHAFRVAELLMVRCYILNQRTIIISQLCLPFFSIKILVVSLSVCQLCTHLDVFGNSFASLTFNTFSKSYNISCNVLLVNNSYMDTFFADEPFIIDFSCYKLLLLTFWSIWPFSVLVLFSSFNNVPLSFEVFSSNMSSFLILHIEKGKKKILTKKLFQNHWF
jgi:hypothetical protein